MPLDVIRTDEELELALARLDELGGVREGEPGWDERTRLIELIAAYEDATVRVPPSDPVDVILFFMEQNDLQQKDLVAYLGSPSKVSEVLARKRSLSKEMIRKLHEGLGIPLGPLLGIEAEVPPGRVRVEWVLPEPVVNLVVEAAAREGISEEDWLASLVLATCTEPAPWNRSGTSNLFPGGAIAATNVINLPVVTRPRRQVA
jgi:HTH-type transcriptional regulator/antitoxin HigA